MIGRVIRIVAGWTAVSALMLPASVLFVFWPSIVVAILRMLPR